MRQLDQSSAAPVSLLRTTPPTPPWLGAELARTLTEVAGREDLGTLLRYHKFAGTDVDRRIGSQWLAGRFGEAIDPERIIVTNGTQNALFIALAVAVGRGGLVLTETLSYYGFRRLAEFLGADVAAVPMDADGARPDAFEAICRERRPKALFLSPTLHNPTTIVMSRERRLALAAAARQHGVAIIEDDVYGMLPSEAPPPIAALAPDVTWHCTGLAKCVAPGLRLGYLVAPSSSEAARAFAPFQTTSTWFVSPLSAAIAEHWVEDGTAARLLGAVREEAAARQIMAADLLSETTYTAKPEALHLWLDLPPAWTQRGFVEAAAAAGVALRTGDMFALEPETAPNAIRVVVGSPETRPALAGALGTIAALVREGAR